MDNESKYIQFLGIKKIQIKNILYYRMENILKL